MKRIGDTELIFTNSTIERPRDQRSNEETQILSRTIENVPIDSLFNDLGVSYERYHTKKPKVHNDRDISVHFSLYRDGMENKGWQLIGDTEKDYIRYIKLQYMDPLFEKIFHYHVDGCSPETSDFYYPLTMNPFKIALGVFQIDECGCIFSPSTNLLFKLPEKQSIMSMLPLKLHVCNFEMLVTTEKITTNKGDFAYTSTSYHINRFSFLTQQTKNISKNHGRLTKEGARIKVEAIDKYLWVCACEGSKFSLLDDISYQFDNGVCKGFFEILSIPTLNREIETRQTA
eukprot:TRINITY_DN1304_c0_g1_i1.p1 TRINITY_DN1304_c0_g1~~TRINITY_DN1304_c0_g1_i1.p1  ORF type:complete len:287 (+),score=56.79 TRINITY_DN1304_c0_g1_i1:90-950(+)